jgi:hypothetical protein
VRADGEADVVARGPDFSLLHHWAAPGSGWRSAQVAAAPKPFLTASIFVRSDGGSDVMALGPGDMLLYCWATPGSGWRSTQIGPPPASAANPAG